MILAIGIGSFIGGILRYGLSQWIQHKSLTTYPFGTLAVNITGCLLIGLVYGLSDKGNLSPEARLFWATGVLGGFTTFSAFSSQTVDMMRDGQYTLALSYIAASVVFGILATIMGILLVKLW